MTCYALLLFMKDIGLQRAIAVAKSQERLAIAIGITKQAVSQWQKVPIERVRIVERVTGISRYELRPDFFLIDD